MNLNYETLVDPILRLRHRPLKPLNQTMFSPTICILNSWFLWQLLLCNLHRFGHFFFHHFGICFPVAKQMIGHAIGKDFFFSLLQGCNHSVGHSARRCLVKRATPRPWLYQWDLDTLPRPSYWANHDAGLASRSVSPPWRPSRFQPLES